MPYELIQRHMHTCVCSLRDCLLKFSAGALELFPLRYHRNNDVNLSCKIPISLLHSGWLNPLSLSDSEHAYLFNACGYPQAFHLSWLF